MASLSGRCCSRWLWFFSSLACSLVMRSICFDMDYNMTNLVSIFAINWVNRISFREENKFVGSFNNS